MQAAEEAWVSEALERAARLARASLQSALPILQHSLDRAHNDAAACVGGGGGAQAHAAALEQLSWLLSLAAAVLADTGHHETPMVPVELLELCEAEDDASRSAVGTAEAMGKALCRVR